MWRNFSSVSQTWLISTPSRKTREDLACLELPIVYRIPCLSWELTNVIWWPDSMTLLMPISFRYHRLHYIQAVVMLLKYCWAQHWNDSQTKCEHFFRWNLLTTVHPNVMNVSTMQNSRMLHSSRKCIIHQFIKKDRLFNVMFLVFTCTSVHS